jgi:hypothetical protein
MDTLALLDILSPQASRNERHRACGGKLSCGILPRVFIRAVVIISIIAVGDTCLRRYRVLEWISRVLVFYHALFHLLFPHQGLPPAVELRDRFSRAYRRIRFRAHSASGMGRSRGDRHHLVLPLDAGERPRHGGSAGQIDCA